MRNIMNLWKETKEIDEKYMLLCISVNQRFNDLIQIFKNESLKKFEKIMEKLLKFENIKLTEDLSSFTEYSAIYHYDNGVHNLKIEVEYEDDYICLTGSDYLIKWDCEYLRKLIYLHMIIKSHLKRGKRTLMNCDLFIEDYDFSSADEIDSYLH